MQRSYWIQHTHTDQAIEKGFYMIDLISRPKRPDPELQFFETTRTTTQDAHSLQSQ